MPLDASIYSLIRPQAPQPGPLDQYTQGLQLRSLVDDQGLKALQRQQLERGIREEEDTSNAYRESGGDPAKLKELLYWRGLVKPAMAVEKTIQDRDKSAAELAKTRMETFASAAKILKDRLPTVRDEQSYQAYREGALQLLGLDQIGKMNLPANYDPMWVRNQAVKAEELFTPKFEMKDIGGKMVSVDVNPFTNPSIAGMQLTKTQTPDSIASNATTRRGQDMTDQRARETIEAGRWTNDLERGIQVNSATGETRPITQGGAPLGQKGKPLTEAQGRGQMFGTRAAEADKILTQIEDKISTLGLAMKQGAEGVPLVGGSLGTAGNMLLSENQQKVEQAQRNFVNAVLRQESGAVISQPEFENARRQYFPQPGDSKAVIEQKRANRQSAIEGFRVMSGPAGERIDAARRAPTPGQSSGGKIGGVDPAKLSDAEIKRELGL